jgi:hypothetical protein
MNKSGIREHEINNTEHIDIINNSAYNCQRQESAGVVSLHKKNNMVEIVITVQNIKGNRTYNNMLIKIMCFNG